MRVSFFFCFCTRKRRIARNDRSPYTGTLLTAYFRPAGPEDAANAHFYSASEINGRLKTWGSIERPMGLNKFGMLLKNKGFEMRRNNGRKGYLVVEITETERALTSKKMLTQDQGR